MMLTSFVNLEIMLPTFSDLKYPIGSLCRCLYASSLKSFIDAYSTNAIKYPCRYPKIFFSQKAVYIKNQIFIKTSVLSPLNTKSLNDLTASSFIFTTQSGRMLEAFSILLVCVVVCFDADS